MTDLRPVSMSTGRLAVSLLAAAIVAVSSHGAAAQPVGDIDAGHQLAEKWCSNCHIIGPEQRRGTSTGAPTFTAIAAMKTTTPLGLHAFLQTPHDRMPDLRLTRTEMDDVVAYIISLRH